MIKAGVTNIYGQFSGNGATNNLERYQGGNDLSKPKFKNYYLVGILVEENTRMTCIYSEEIQVPHLVQRACSIEDRPRNDIFFYEDRFICEGCIKAFKKRHEPESKTWIFPDKCEIQRKMFDPVMVRDSETAVEMKYGEMKERDNKIAEHFNELKIQNERLEKELSKIHGSYEEQNTLVAAQKIKIEAMEEDKSHNKSNANTRSWTFSDVKKKIDDMKQGIKNAPDYLISDTHTAPGGYRISIKIYPYGDGAGIGRFVSVFIQIENENVDQATWPFKKKFQLKARQNGKVIGDEKFTPNPASGSFIRPTRKYGQANVASGSPTLIPHKSVVKNEPLTIDVIYS